MRLLYLSILIGLSVALHGQEPTRVQASHISISFGGGYQSALDHFQSPLHYRGWGGGLGLGFMRHGNKWIFENEVFAFGHALSPNIAHNPLNASKTSLEADMQNMLLREMKAQGKWRYFVGVSTPVFVQYRTHSGHSNSSETWNAYALIGPAGGLMYHFKLFRKAWIVENYTSLPVWGYGSKPSFTRNFNRFWENASPRHWGNAFQLQNNLRLRMLMLQGNQIGLQYRWAFYHDSVDNLAQLAGHRLQFYLLFKL